MRSTTLLRKIGRYLPCTQSKNFFTSAILGAILITINKSTALDNSKR
jgi:hypothetical protein